MRLATRARAGPCAPVSRRGPCPPTGPVEAGVIVPALARLRTGSHVWIDPVSGISEVSRSLTKFQLMRIDASLVLIATGATLEYALTIWVSGVNLSPVGVVLMVLGILGLVITIILASTARRTDVVHHSAREGYAEPLP
jgi:hypothetical protein